MTTLVTQTMTDESLAQIVWDYMRFEQPLKKSDLIIVLGGHDLSTVEYASKLYFGGYAPRILFSGGTGYMTPAGITSEADWFAGEALRLGVPAEAILQASTSTNTGENIRFAYELLTSRGEQPQRVIVVHNPYMLRRDFATIVKQWPDSDGIEFILSAEDIAMDEYIVRREPLITMVAIMLGDLQRIREYPKRGFQIELDIPENVWSAYEELVRRGYTQHLLAGV